VAARLSHPGLVVCHDVGKDPASGKLFIVFEYLKGRTLADCAAEGRWTGAARSRSCCRRPGRSTTRTSTAWSTATSSRRTSCSSTRPRPGLRPRAPRRPSRSWTSGWPVSNRPDRGSPGRGSPSAPRSTCRRSRRWVRHQRPLGHLLAGLGPVHAAPGPALVRCGEPARNRPPRGP
jgi:hypothetical protein